jgi:glycogen synthase
MRVLVVSNLYPPDYVGGYELGCRQVVDSLRSRGHGVRVLTSVPRAPIAAEPHVRRRLKFGFDGWNAYYTGKSAPIRSRLHEAESLQINASNVYSLIQEINDFQPDVVYLWMLTGLGGLGLVGCLHHLQVPWVWHLMDDVPLMMCKTQAQLVPVLAQEFGRQVRGYYLACSQLLVNESENGGVPLKGEVEIIPNWVTRDPVNTRTEYLQGGTLRLVSAGHLAPHKGTDVIIEAASLLKNSGYRNFQIDLFGRGDEMTYRASVLRRGLSDHVTFQGLRSQVELMNLFAHYDLFAFPTWEREPFGFAPLEAAASGCVPLVSEICGISEWMVDGVHCLKAPRTAEAFAFKFQQVMDGAIDLRPLGRRASAMIRREFHLRNLIPRIERMLDRAAKAERPAGGSTADAYRLALLAEKLTQVLIEQSFEAA